MPKEKRQFTLTLTDPDNLAKVLEAYDVFFKTLITYYAETEQEDTAIRMARSCEVYFNEFLAMIEYNDEDFAENEEEQDGDIDDKFGLD